MNVTSFAIGSYGDVKPFIILGKELKKRGHNFTIVTFNDFKDIVKSNGLEFREFHGDVKKMMSSLLSENKGMKSSLDTIKKFLNDNSDVIYSDLYNACKEADIIIYMQFGALAYHFAEKFKIKCVRTFVFPYDHTKLYSPMFPTLKSGSLKCKITYSMNDLMMNWASKETVNNWRKKMSLSKWSLASSYRKMNNEKILTLYQYSEVLAPRDKKWGEHIHITGPWLEKSGEYTPEESLEKFIKEGEAPLYIGFGSMVYKDMEKLQNNILEALKRTGQRAIFVSSWSKFQVDKSNKNIYYSDFIPFDWLFPRVKAVVNHGGSGTVSLAIMHEKPLFIMAFGADQLFWGTRVNELGIGPKPVDVSKDVITVDLLESRFLELKQDKYKFNIKKPSEKIKKERGYKEACDLIENEFKKGGRING